MSDNGNSMGNADEGSPADVQDELEQDHIDVAGPRREPSANEDSPSDHMGAVDGETTPIIAPPTGPGGAVEDESHEVIDPRDELTPG